jgi:CPA1 family monovalent cation:H+ antiporter
MAVVGAVIVVARIAEPTGLPVPLVLLAVGVLASFLPFVPDVGMSPDLVLFGLLPPLLYAAAISTSLIDIRRNTVPILSLSVGLVLFTALGVALVTRWLVPDIPFAVAFALGAVVAPPDAVAATAVARRIGLPRRTTTILEGESLLNDATALVSLRTALAAAGLSTHGVEIEKVTTSSVLGNFAWAVVGGVGIGFAAFVLIGLVRKHLTSAAADTALSWIAPFVAFVPAEKVHASGVLSVVTAGLLLAHKAPLLQSAASRLSERTNWASLTFVLENTVFLLIGLQMYGIVRAVNEGEVTMGRTLVLAGVVLLACLVLRPVWLVPFTWLVARRDHDNRTARMKAGLVSAWAGMRGVVTLAAALTLPEDTTYRDSLVMVALVVTVGTLALQSLTLPALARALDVRGPDPREDALIEATVVGASTGAGLRAIEDHPHADDDTVNEIRTQATRRVNRIWERLGAYGESEVETPSQAYRRVRLRMIEAEREEILKMRETADVDQHVLAGILNAMDAEEAALTYGIEKEGRVVGARPLRPPNAATQPCEHLRDEPDCTVPKTPEGCEECLEMGSTWVHLRLCTQCGHVGCCDSSPNRHADAHFRETDHPVMRSLEPGEAWRWCFVDEVLG